MWNEQRRREAARYFELIDAYREELMERKRELEADG